MCLDYRKKLVFRHWGFTYSRNWRKTAWKTWCNAQKLEQRNDFLKMFWIITRSLICGCEKTFPKENTLPQKPLLWSLSQTAKIRNKCQASFDLCENCNFNTIFPFTHVSSSSTMAHFLFPKVLLGWFATMWVSFFATWDERAPEQIGSRGHSNIVVWHAPPCSKISTSHHFCIFF